MALADVIPQRMAMLDDWRLGVLRQPEKLRAGVLTEDGIDERVEEEIRLRDADVAEEVLHSRAGATDERTMPERLVLRAFLPDDEHARRIVCEPAAIEHRAEVPAELFAAAQRAAETAIIGRLGKQTRPLAIRWGPRVVFPGQSAILQEVHGNAECRVLNVEVNAEETFSIQHSTFSISFF